MLNIFESLNIIENLFLKKASSIRVKKTIPSTPEIQCPPYVNFGKDAYLNPGVKLVTPPTLGLLDTGIYLGNNCIIGSDTLLEVSAGQKLEIGEFASTNKNCTLGGNIHVSNHAMISALVYIASGTHLAKEKPTWLIRDQDRLIEDPELRKKNDKKVYIGEDAWIGYGAYIHPGVYIGRGAVIGPYSFVGRDVPPYSMQIGIPSREYDKRLVFDPQPEIFAREEMHLPYFYEGFHLRQVDIAESQKLGIHLARNCVSIILPRGNWKKLAFSGKLLPRTRSIQLKVTCQGTFLGEIEISKPGFEMELPFKVHVETSKLLPSVMQNYFQIDFEVTGLEADTFTGTHYGLASISVK